MHLNLEYLYYNSPPFIQNILVSMYGYKLKHQRYGGKSKVFFDQLIKSEKMDPIIMGKYRNKMFLKLITHAFATVPFYKDYCRKSGLSLQDIGSLDDIDKLPIISKDMIREDPRYFCSDKYLNKKNTFWLSTSGTSGKPLNLLCDKESRQKHYAFWSRFRTNCKLPYYNKRSTFYGQIIMSAEVQKPPFWRYDVCGKNYLFSSYHLSDDNLAYYYQKLVKIKVSEIVGYPSSLIALAKYCKKNGLDAIRPIAIITTAETLIPHQRELLEDVFQCNVFDQYGCSEMVIFVSQCEYGTYHIHPEYGYVEVISNNGNKAKTGEVGHAVCTGFVNRAMPLIRYKLGDQIAINKKECQCGRAFDVIDQLVGRTDDILVTPDGIPLGRLDPVFKGRSGIYETQIIQESYNKLTINMVVDQNFNKKMKKEFLYELKKRVGHQMEIHIQFVSNIPKDENGKFRSVISLI